MSIGLLNIILYCFVIIFALIGMFISILVLSVMFFYRSTIKKYPIEYLLLANSFIALFSAAPLFIDMSIYSIYGNLNPQSSFIGFWCRFKSYLLYIHGYVYFYSFLLQAIHRFCRIVYHTRVKLQSFRFYAIISGLLWFNGFWQLLPCLFLGHIDYIVKDFHCQFPPTYLMGSLIGLSIMFLVPYFSTLIFYLCTMCYVRKRSLELGRINRRINIRRDLIIFRHIIIILTFVIFVAIPHVIIPFIYIIFGYLPTWTCSFEWLTTVIALDSVAIIQIFMSPFLRQLFFR